MLQRLQFLNRYQQAQSACHEICGSLPYNVLLYRKYLNSLFRSIRRAPLPNPLEKGYC